MKENARSMALKVLIACRKNGAWADASLKAALSSESLSAADAALCSRLVYGVVQNKLLLDYYLSAFCSQKPEKLQPPLLDILRLGAYQILYMDRIPVSAAVNESVELAKMNRRAAAAGLVNAVLRKLDREKSSLPPLPEKETERLSVQYSHPLWLTERFQKLLGDEKEALISIHIEAVPMVVQVNPLKTTAAALKEELNALGVSVEAHPTMPDTFYLANTGDLASLSPFGEGKFTVQDTAASLVAHAAGFTKGARVLDVCAAPGGKSFSAAFRMENSGEIIACDLHENKLKRVREGAKRLGITNIRTETADGRVFREAWENAFDFVLCDVPCSGLGIIRKKPDIRYKDPAALAELPPIQRGILDNASRYVKPGGVLLYSTCTVLREENEEQTDAFLTRHTDFSYEDFSLPDGKSAPYCTLWPHRDGTDGFFICKLRKEA